MTVAIWITSLVLLALAHRSNSRRRAAMTPEERGDEDFEAKNW